VSELVRTGRLLLDGVFVPGTITCSGGRIARIESLAGTDLPEDAPLIAPGLIDLHVHGFGGCEPLSDLAGMAAALASSGTTAFLPTLFPDDPASLSDDIAQVGRQTLGEGRARVLGLHLEGPFVNPAAAGALPPERLAEPSPAGLALLLASGAASAGVRTVTVAPELSGARDLIRALVAEGVRPSLGHSLATCAEARAAAEDGACGATHLFNAMRPWHHREGGLAGFALTDSALYAEIIGDLEHVSAEGVALALEARGPSGLCLISDALAGAGTGCDVFEVPGHTHAVRHGGAFYREEGGERSLLGSALGLLEAVRGLRDAGVVSLEEALTMASETPARALGMEAEVGRLVERGRADLLLLDPADLGLREVLVGGEPAQGIGSSVR